MVAQQLRRRVRQTLGGSRPLFEGRANAVRVLVGGRLAPLRQALEVLPRLLGPAGGRVAREVVLPGPPRGVVEVEALECEGAVEPGLLGRIRESERLLRGLERPGDVGGARQGARRGDGCDVAVLSSATERLPTQDLAPEVPVANGGEAGSGHAPRSSRKMSTSSGRADLPSCLNRVTT